MVEFEDELEEEFDEEFDDEFEEDWEEFEPEAEEFFTGPLYIPTESSVNFELYSLLGAIVVMIIASYMLYTNVLVGVYDSGFGGGSYDEKVANYDYQQAKGKVEILGFGKYNPENDKEPFDYAVLDAGSKQGISAGMIYYFHNAKGTGTRNGYWSVEDPMNPKAVAKLQIKKEELTMLVVRKVGEDYAWAEFAKYISDDDKEQFKSTTGEELKDVLHDYVVQKQPSYNVYTDTKSPVTLETPFPYKPKPRKPLQYFIWEEAYDLSGDKTYKTINLETIDKNFNIISTAVEEDYADPNTDWNVMRRIKLTIDEIIKLLEIKDEEPINESSFMVTMNNEKLTNALILFNKAQFAYIAPPFDQTLFRIVSNKLDEMKKE